MNSSQWLRFQRDPRRALYAQRFGLTNEQLYKRVEGSLTLDQLDDCKDDAARRLLLGISERQGAREQGSEGTRTRVLGVRR